jgi:PAS domain S-box-containing protein
MFLKPTFRLNSITRQSLQDILSLLLSLLMNLSLLSNSFAEPPHSDTLLFLGNKNLAPVVYLDDGIPSGVAVDIVRALAEHLSQPVEIKAMDWSEAQMLVARGEADALIQINPTEERKKIYDFSDTLLESQFCIFTAANRDGISGPSSLRGLRVGVESGGLPRLVLEKDPLIQLTVIANFLEGFKSLNEAALDAVVVDYLVGSYVLAENKIRNIKVTGAPIVSSSSSIAVRKGNTTLLSEINHGLQLMKAEGTYRKILDTWKPKEGRFYSREQISRLIFFAAISLLLVVFLIAAIWMVTLKKELAQRKAAEGKLREQHSTLRSIIDSTNALIFAVDRQYRYTSFNRGHAAAMKALYGAEIEQGRSLLECMTVPEDREIARRNLDRTLAGEQFLEESYSGEEFRSRHYFQISHSPIKTQQEEIIGVAVFAQDITARKLAEESLRRLNRELQAISNCNQTLMRATDEQALLTDICRIICDDAGYRMAWVGYAEDDDAKSVRPVAWAGSEDGYLADADITWADAERGRGPTGTAIRSGESACLLDFSTEPQAAPWRENALSRGYRSSIALPLKDESAKTFGALTLYSTAPNAFTTGEIHLLEELAGNLAFGIIVLRTRTERRQMEQALTAREKEFRSLVENIPDFIVRYDVNLCRIFVNPAWEKASGLSLADVIDKPSSETPRVPKPIVPEYVDSLRKALATGTRQSLEFTWVNAFGTELFLEYVILPEYDAGGKVTSVLAVGHDITELKRFEEEKNRLNAELEQRVKQRTAELEQKNAELDRMNRLFVGRELRMKELKEKIARLEGKENQGISVREGIAKSGE